MATQKEWQDAEKRVRRLETIYGLPHPQPPQKPPTPYDPPDILARPEPANDAEKLVANDSGMVEMTMPDVLAVPA